MDSSPIDYWNIGTIESEKAASLISASLQVYSIYGIRPWPKLVYYELMQVRQIEYIQKLLVCIHVHGIFLFPAAANSANDFDHLF